jgi:ATP-dependent DNA ligase
MKSHALRCRLLHIDNEDLTRKILEKGGKRLEKEFAAVLGAMRLSPILSGEARNLLAHAKAFEFEGIVAKRVDSVYVAEKTSDNWQKQNTQRSETF